MTKTISSTDLNRQPGVWLKLVEQGETIEITKRDKVVAVLGPPTNPTVAYMDHIQQVHDEGRKRRAKATGKETTVVDPETLGAATGEVDDWGLPIDEGLAPEHQPVKSVSYDHDVRYVGTNPPEMVVSSKPAWKAPGGLSKAAQAGGKYDR